MDYKYHLKKYAGKASRLTCPNCQKPNCFTPYVDDKDEILDKTVGRCDHEGSCGYHKTPGEFFKEHPELKEPDWRWQRLPVKPAMTATTNQPTKEPDFIPWDIVRRSVRLNPESALITFLRTLFDDATIKRLVEEYFLGVTRDKSAIFFQIDRNGHCRGGKIIRYNPETGHRIKDDASKIPVDWIHPRLKSQGILPSSWTMTQCLFGEHLLTRYPDRMVALVEAEKTALIGAGFIPEYNWLATGGRSGVNDRVNVLEGKKILIFPDVDAYDYWKEKFKARPKLEIYISDYLQKSATEEDLNNHIDIADWLIRWHNDPDTVSLPPETPIQPIQEARHQLTIQELKQYLSPESMDQVTQLVEDLDLEIKSVTYIKPEENENND